MNFVAPEESPRIENAEKAEAMARAPGVNELRSSAARRRHRVNETLGNVRDSWGNINDMLAERSEDIRADTAEDRAGAQYDAERSRIQDPAKAEEMARTDRVNSLRSIAADYRTPSWKETPAERKHWLERSKPYDAEASALEDETAKKYDEAT